MNTSANTLGDGAPKDTNFQTPKYDQLTDYQKECLPTTNLWREKNGLPLIEVPLPDEGCPVKTSQPHPQNGSATNAAEQTRAANFSETVDILLEPTQKNFGSNINDVAENNFVVKRINHNDIFQKLIEEIQEVDFHDLIGIDKSDNLKQKHFVFGIVKHVLETAKKRRWNLCLAYGYVYLYNGAYWRQCTKEDLKKFLADAGVKMGLPDYEVRHYEFTDKLIKQFLSDAHLPAREPDKEKILINLRNGTFEVTRKGCSHQAFDPDDFLTYQLLFDYDPSATCHLFDTYLSKVLPDESSRNVLQEFAGYILTNLNLEKCLVLLGSGGNGKSVFMNILCALFGKENILNYSLGLFTHEYNRAKLTNVLLNYSSEKGFDLNPDIFKALVSAEPLQAREVYQKPFTLYNRAKFITNCNELPKETESTDAYFRRFLIVPFDVKISEAEKDISLAEKVIENELPGVFNWMLAGLNRLLGTERGGERFSNCPKAEKALGDFRKQSDSVQLFVEEKNYEPSSSNKEPLTDLYNLYKNFCLDDGYKSLGKNRFSQRMERKGFEKTRIGGIGSAAFMIEIKKEF